MNKILICYDISENDEDKRESIEKILKLQKNSNDWVKQNKSGWIILTNLSVETWYNYFSSTLKDKNSKFEIINISNIEVKYKGYIEMKTSNSLKIISSEY